MTFLEQSDQFLNYVLNGTNQPRTVLTPYFYVIKSKTLDAYYVGIRYSKKDSIPALFWQNYFTSSSTVTECINKYGIDDFEIVNIIDKDPNGNDWDFPGSDSFRLGNLNLKQFKSCGH